MTTTAIVPSVPKSTAIESREYTYSPDEIKLIQETVAPGLSATEFKLFMYVAKVRNLDPLQRQVHAVKRKSNENGQWVERMTIQTGIDGYRAIANRTGLYMPSDRLPLIEGAGTKDLRATVWVKKWSVLDKQWHDYGATAYYREFVQTKKSGDSVAPNSMWEKMALNQLTKCAEALALRKGWPEELGQLYTDDEMQSHGEVVQQGPPPKQDKTQREVGTLKASTEPNRGHGQEGLKEAKQDDWICAECRQTNCHLKSCSQCASWLESLKSASPVATPAPAGSAEPKPTQTVTQTVEAPEKPANAKAAVKVVKITEKSKDNAGKKQPYFVLDVTSNDGEWQLYVWHKSLFDQAVTLDSKMVLIEYSQKEAKGRTYCSLEAILEVQGETKEEEF